MSHEKCGCGKETDFAICENGHVQKIYNKMTCSRCKSGTWDFVCLRCTRSRNDEALERLKKALSPEQLQLFMEYFVASNELTSMVILD